MARPRRFPRQKFQKILLGAKKCKNLNKKMHTYLLARRVIRFSVFWKMWKLIPFPVFLLLLPLPSPDMAASLFADPRHTRVTRRSFGDEKLSKIDDFSTKLSQNRSIFGETPSKSIKTHWFLMIPTSKSTIS